MVLVQHLASSLKVKVLLTGPTPWQAGQPVQVIASDTAARKGEEKREMRSIKRTKERGRVCKRTNKEREKSVERMKEIGE